MEWLLPIFLFAGFIIGFLAARFMPPHVKPLSDTETDIFGDPVRLRLVDELPSLGAWDERDGTISILRDQPEVGKRVILLHELMHMAETMLKQQGIIKRRITHEFISNAPLLILAFLVEAGVISGVTREDMLMFIDEQTVDLRRSAGQDSGEGEKS